MFSMVTIPLVGFGYTFKSVVYDEVLLSFSTILAAAVTVNGRNAVFRHPLVKSSIEKVMFAPVTGRNPFTMAMYGEEVPATLQRK